MVGRVCGVPEQDQCLWFSALELVLTLSPSPSFDDLDVP